MNRRPRQRESHHHLLRDVSHDTGPGSISMESGLAAIIVPTARPAVALRNVIRMSGELGVPLLAVCSGQARVDDVITEIESDPMAQGIAVHLPPGYVLPHAPTRTSAVRLLAPSAGRSSDLSVKRNLGLLLARMVGWNKIFFLDDDIEEVRPEHIARLEAQLDVHNMAGMRCTDFPDNSVVCHAHRLAGHWQDNFVSGAALG